MSLEILARSLPEQFPFYHLGEVALTEEPPTSWSEEGVNAFAFSLRGDIEGLLLVAVDSAEDASLYSEVGNLLASGLANKLDSAEGLDIVISPPQPIETARLRALLESPADGLSKVEKTYLHRYENKLVPVRTLLITAVTGVVHV